MGLFSYQIQYQCITKTRTNPENIWPKIKKAPFLAWRRFLPVNDWDSNILSAITHTNFSQKKNRTYSKDCWKMLSTWEESRRRRRRNRKTHQKVGQENCREEAETSIPVHIFLGFLWAWESKRDRERKEESERPFIYWTELTTMLYLAPSIFLFNTKEKSFELFQFHTKSLHKTTGSLQTDMKRKVGHAQTLVRVGVIY